MLLTITTTRRPATDLAVLLGKDPGRVERVELAWGAAHVFFPEAGEERCTAALLVEVDPLELAGSSPKRGPTGPLSLYVNDRPYVAGSTTSAAIGLVLSSALRGTSGEWEPADRALPLEARLPALSCRGGERAVRALFEPLGYEVEVGPLDPRPPESSATTVASVTLRREGRLAELLSHLRVLLPVLDHDEHDLVDLDEVAKLATRGEGWLAEHPAREAIVARYRRPKLARWA
ncbi:MAG TPA: 3' terminal RNA ribose 2'-O-methyltransferase Hen1, partial [Sandaracinaceae bacterium]